MPRDDTLAAPAPHSTNGARRAASHPPWRLARMLASRLPAATGRAVALTAAAVGVALVAYAAICGYTALALTQPERQPFRLFPEQDGLAYESVSFASRVDAVLLDGWLLLPPDAAPPRRPIVAVHGKGVDRTREAHDHLLEIAAGLVGQGRPVLLFDLRGCGRSGGERYTLGAKEVWDLGGAIDFLASRGLDRDGVDLLGYSMGGATVLLDGSDERLVRAVAEDSGYAELGSLIDDQLPKESHLPALFTPGTLLLARPLVGIDVDAIRPIDHVPALAARGVPLLVIHEDADSRIPVSHGQRLAAAYGPGVQTLFVRGAEHVRSYEAEPAAYLATLDTFFDHADATPTRPNPGGA